MWHILMRQTPYLVAFLAVVSVPVRAIGQRGSVPQAGGDWLTGPQERERNSRIYALRTEIKELSRTVEERRAEGTDTKPLQQQVERKESELRELWGPTYDYRTIEGDRWREVAARLRLDRDRTDDPLTADEAASLLDELYFDYGVPEVNDQQQLMALQYIQIVLREGDLSASIRRQLTDGLVEYVAAGGGTSSPWVMRKLATGLAAGAMPGNSEALELAYAFREESRAWDESLLLTDMSTLSREMMENLFERHDVVRDLLGLSGGISDSGQVVEAIPKQLRDRLQKAVARMLELLPKSRQSASKLGQMRRIALDDYKSRVANDEILSLLLTFYRYLLRDSFRGGTEPNVVRRIDAHLLELLEESRGPLETRNRPASGDRPSESRRRSSRHMPNRLLTASHWKLWSEVAVALQKRVSDTLMRALSKRLGDEQDPTIKEAVKSAYDALIGVRRADK